MKANRHCARVVLCNLPLDVVTLNTCLHGLLACAAPVLIPPISLQAQNLLVTSPEVCGAPPERRIVDRVVGDGESNVGQVQADLVRPNVGVGSWSSVFVGV